MTAALDVTRPPSHIAAIDGRAASIDWPPVAAHLDENGWVVLKNLLSAAECRSIASLYGDDGCFRSHIVMARHGFGRGEYKYFASPLPDIVANLRTALYPRLAPIADRWNEAMRIDVRYPASHEDFICRCHKAGQ